VVNNVAIFNDIYEILGNVSTSPSRTSGNTSPCSPKITAMPAGLSVEVMAEVLSRY